jgi:chloramphenicol-sensitive protein RarD
MIYALAGILFWGMSPLFWKTLAAVPVWEVLLHRVVWSALFLLVWVWRRGRLGELWTALRNPRQMATLSVTTLLIGVNWYLYIWGVNNAHILETSMGYFILPLVVVLLGVVFLGEKLRRWQIGAVTLAAAGVLNLVLSHGRLPWLALVLAGTFAAYAILRKTAAVDALMGLAAETLILSVPAAAALVALAWRGEMAAPGAGWSTWALLAATPAATALPLLWYTEGARRLPLKTLGILQYISPTCQFLIGAFLFREPLARPELVSFALVWAGLAVYTADAVAAGPRCPRPS